MPLLWWMELDFVSLKGSAVSSSVCLCVRVSMGLIWCWGPARGALPVAKVMRKEAQHTQRRDRASGVSLEILEHLPA